MNNDIRHAMKFLMPFFLLIALSGYNLNGQSPHGTLKIFSDNPLVVYVDETHYPQYGEIKLIPGTHWVKAINANGVRVYSQIVTVKAGEVTSVLIEAPQAAIPASHSTSAQKPQGQMPAQQTTPGQAGVSFTQTASGAQAGQAGSAAENSQTPEKTVKEEAPAVPKQTIDIGQVRGKLPSDMSGAFGLTFGMSTVEVDQIMAPKAAQVQRSSGYSVYAIPYGSSAYLVECRFIDLKLFQIIVGYVSTSTNNSKLKLNKGEVPVPEFNQMVNDVTAIYGSPASVEKILPSGYSEDDVRLLEALKRKKALLLYTWTDPATGNNIMVGLGYTTAPLAATIYTSGPMHAEAAARKLRIHSYSYHIPFKDNYFSN